MGNKKVGIVTITLGSNFGNRLQNYALQEVIKKLGYEPETIKNLTSENRVFVNFPFSYRLCMDILGSNVIGAAFAKYSKNARLIKKVKFAEFNEKYIKWSSCYLEKQHIPSEISTMYDAYVCGSDQIWNPNMKFNSDIEFLSFVNNRPKIAYAASFGVNDIPKERLLEIKELLRDYTGISLREKRGVEILNTVGITGARLVLDPTLLLDKHEWEKLESRPSFIREGEKYILLYNLKSDSEQNGLFVDKLSSEKGWKVIDVLDEKNPQFYGVGPREFLYLIHNSEYVCTDSFHATVFSLLFHKQFVVFNRHNMSSRIDTLLEIGGFQDRFMTTLKNTFFDNNRYDLFDDNLKYKKEHSVRFLQNYLENLGD